MRKIKRFGSGDSTFTEVELEDLQVQINACFLDWQTIKQPSKMLDEVFLQIKDHGQDNLSILSEETDRALYQLPSESLYFFDRRNSTAGIFLIVN